MIPATSAEVYRCPGETYDITRSVHLARLAVSYPKCRHCHHAPGATIQLETAESRPGLACPSKLALFTSEGVRGLYLNQLTRATAAGVAGAMASCLWDDVSGPEPNGGASVVRAPPVAMEVLNSENDASETCDTPSPGEGVRVLAPAGTGPAVALAHDHRPSSPDIVIGVGQALRRMGCQVVDIGLATRPCLAFAIDHLRARAGVHVTGSGCDTGWSGLDFFFAGIVPCSFPGELDRIATRFRDGYSRPSRRPGSQRPFHAAVPYEASLWKHFHALRPLKIVLGCPNPTVQDLFARVFRKVACRLLPVEIPTRARSALDFSDPAGTQISRQVQEAGADLGAHVEEDGEGCLFFDEQGRHVPPPLIAKLLVTGIRIGPGGNAPDSSPVESPGGRPSREAITVAMQRSRTAFAHDGAGRYWFAEPYPACDALLTLVHLLHVLSRSDTPFSQVVAA